MTTKTTHFDRAKTFTRLATEADVQAIMDIERKNRGEDEWFELGEEWREEMAENYREAINNRHTPILMQIKDGKPTGYVMIQHIPGGLSELRFITIDPDMRRQGLSKKLYKDAFKFVRSKGRWPVGEPMKQDAALGAFRTFEKILKSDADKRRLQSRRDQIRHGSDLKGMRRKKR